MQSYLLEVYSPAGRAEFRAAVARLRGAAQSMTRERTPVTYRRSLLLPEDEMSFHVVEGISRQAVDEVARRAAIDCARVIEVVQ